jgi:hypothetical protein
MLKYAISILKSLKDPEFRGLLLFVSAILITGTYFYHIFEKWRWLDCFYFSVTTLTTVGYGDFAPQSDAGKIFTIIYIFIGVGVILGFVNAVARHAESQNKNNIQKIKKLKKYGTRK